MLVRYVNTASSAGGDGTTNATSGDHRAYASLNEFESSEQAVLSDAIECICEGSSVDGTKVKFDGWTTTAAYYIYVHTTQANRHDGKWNTSKYRLDFSDAGDPVIQCLENYARFEGLQLYNSHATSGYGFRYDGTGEVQFSYNILKGSVCSVKYRSIYLEAMGASTVKIWNNVLYNLEYGIYYDYDTSGSTFIVYNNTIVDISVDGIHIKDAVGDQTAYIKNNLVFNTADDYDLTAFTTRSYDHNMGEDDDSGSQTNYVQTSQAGTSIFVDYNNDDFHIKSGSDAKDAGADLSGDAHLNITDDIDGNSRSSPFDIGGDEILPTYTLTMGSGSFTLTGQDVSLLADRILSMGVGSFVLTGADVDLLRGRFLSMDSGSFILTGADIDLIYSITYLLNMGSGSFALTGADVTLLANRRLSIGSGSFALTGQNVDLLFGRALSMGSGSFVLSGTDIDLLYNRLLSMDSGSFTLTGANVDLLFNRLLSMGAGTFILTGQDITFTWSGLPVGKMTIAFTPRKPGHVFTPRKPGHVFTPRKPGITLIGE